jgi:hypothetical protein
VGISSTLNELADRVAEMMNDKLKRTGADTDRTDFVVTSKDVVRP